MTPPEPRRVLIAVGSDLFMRDLALALLRRGWLPIIYAPQLIGAAEQLRRATIPVVSDINAIGVRPDVIHGHHVLETLAALAKFPDVPALFVCHDSLTWHSIPPRSRRIRTWVAVDRNCRDRMMIEHGIPEDAIHVLTNAIDLERFARRGPLPQKPRRALVFSNAASEAGFAAPIRTACERRGITLDLAGESSGRPTNAPETILPQYDLVFAKARCALEAAAVGAAVVVCDAAGLAGMVTTESFDAMRQLNFGARLLRRDITTETIGEAIDRYDAADATAVSDRVRALAGVDLLAEQYIALSEELCAVRDVVPPAEQLEDVARTLASVAPRIYQQLGTPRTVMRLRRAIVNSRILAGPLKIVYRLRKRLRS
ncbi:MAG TPA: glycosyltransferase family 4 protein [Thermoanaerobaculia bacterium]|nr:glycosyltransferase family 4 protein [Thermoanaerobaculia bacterium]